MPRQERCSHLGRAGFTLLELLITIMLIGIIAAIAIPGLVSAIQRGKQKSTMGAIRSIGTAVEEYMIDESSPPNGTGTVQSTLCQPFFTPPYIRICPAIDYWENSLCYQSSGAFSGERSNYSVYSFARYGADDLAVSMGEYDVRSFHYDICLSDGRFTCMPGLK